MKRPNLALLLSLVALFYGCSSDPEPPISAKPKENGLNHAELQEAYFLAVEPIPQEEIDVLLSSGVKFSRDELPVLHGQLCDFFQSVYEEDTANSPVHIVYKDSNYIELSIDTPESLPTSEHLIFGFHVNQRKLTDASGTD